MSSCSQEPRDQRIHQGSGSSEHVARDTFSPKLIESRLQQSSESACIEREKQEQQDASSILSGPK